MERSFKGVWIPAEIWLRKDLTIGEKMLFVEIQSFDNNFGCIASNKKLGEDIQLTPTSVSRALKILEEKCLVIVTYENYVTFSGRRIITTPCVNDKPPCVNDKPPYQNDKHSNTFSNTFSKEDTNVSFVGLSTPTTTPVINDLSKRCQIFIKKFNDIRIINNKPSKFLSNSTLCSTLKQRLKVYTPEEIISVVKNCIKDDYHIGENLKYVTPEYVLRLKTIERYKQNSEINSEEIITERQMVY